MDCSVCLCCVLGSTKDVQSAYADIDDVIRSLEEARNDESLYANLFADMERLHSEPLSKPRLAQKQTLRSNHPCETTAEYYKLAYYYPYLDYLVTDLKIRFQHSPDVLKG